MELWLPVKGYEGRYSVSNRGDVKSHLTGKLLVQSYNTFGYKQVSLHKSGKQDTKTVHRLVAEAFLPNPNNLPYINHKDEDKTNNDVSNLEWCTHQYNTEYSCAKEFTFVSPVGEIVDVFNLSAFCRDNKLDKSAMQKVSNGLRKSHKGWKSII